MAAGAGMPPIHVVVVPLDVMQQRVPASGWPVSSFAVQHVMSGTVGSRLNSCLCDQSSAAVLAAPSVQFPVGALHRGVGSSWQVELTPPTYPGRQAAVQVLLSVLLPSQLKGSAPSLRNGLLAQTVKQ